MKLKIPSLQVTTNTTRSSNDVDELSGKLFADESLKNGECKVYKCSSHILKPFQNNEGTFLKKKKKKLFVNYRLNYKFH